VVKKKKKINISSNGSYYNKVQKKQNRNNKVLIFVGIGTAVVIILALVLINYFQMTAEDPSDDKKQQYVNQLQSVTNPLNTTGEGGILVIPTDPTNTANTASYDQYKVTVEVFMDPICPACGSFEQTYGDFLREKLQNGEINYIIRPVAIMDRGTSSYALDHYSTRAAASIVSVANYDPQHLIDYIMLLFSSEKQPPETNYPGIDDSFFTQVAMEAGVDVTVASQIAEFTRSTDPETGEETISGEFVPFVEIATNIFEYGPDYRDDEGILSTPQLWVGGYRIDPSYLETAINEIQTQMDEYYSTQSSS